VGPFLTGEERIPRLVETRGLEPDGKGAELPLAEFDAIETFSSVQKTFAPTKSGEPKEISVTEEGEISTSGADYKAELLSIVKALPPAGFERLCQRLLRESGFQQVVVTGRTAEQYGTRRQGHHHDHRNLH
jgi:hypothetical protein